MSTFEDLYRTSYQSDYKTGYFSGYLIGQVEALVSFIEKADKEIIDMSSLLDNNYYKEIKEIIKKYPNYCLSHKAKKVIFESTYLPY